MDDVLTLPVFTQTEVALVTGVNQPTVAVWLNRGLDLGKRNRRGKRAFSFVDIIAAEIVAQLSMGFTVGPSLSKAVIPFIEPRAAEIVGTDADGLFAFVEPTQAGQVYLALHPDPSNDTLRVCALSGAELLDECSSNRSVIIVPLDRIIVRTIRRIGELVEIHLEEDDE